MLNTQRSFFFKDKADNISYLVFCFLCLLFFAESSESAFRDSFTGAKSMAMGGAYTALADDADGGLVNPAGLSMIRNRQIVATMSAMYVGLSDNSLISQNIVGYAYKQGNIGTLGVVWKRLSASDLYSENIVALSFSKPAGIYLTKGVKNFKNFSFGGTLKFMNWDSAPTIGTDGRTIEDLPGWSGISFDVGFVIWPSENTPVGVAFQNLLQSDTASRFSKVEEKLPMVTRMGVAAIDKKSVWLMDMVLKSGQLDLKMGLERRERNGIFLRAGFGLENLAWGMNFTAGAGYKPNNSMRIDYAFVYPINTILDTMGSHRISVVYNFGEKRIE